MRDEDLIGKTIHVIYFDGEPEDRGDVWGTIKYIDDMGQIHFSGSGLAVIPEVDIFEIVE